VVPAVHFLQRIRLDEVCDKHIEFSPRANARYSLSVSLFITITDMIAGASSLLKVIGIWSDQVLRQVSGLVLVPDDSTLRHIFQKGTLKHVTQINL
jgi:hypothetical protein